jgi:hypothetical protein
VGDDAREGVSTALVLSEDLAEEAPGGGEWVEQSVAELDAVLIDGVEDAALARGVGEGQPLVARETGADPLGGGIGNLECVGRGLGFQDAGVRPSPYPFIVRAAP